MSVENIFGTQDTVDIETPAENPFAGMTLNLSDEDLTASASQYTPIPQGTITAFNIYEVTTRTSKAGNPQWSLTLNAVEDTWGPNKRVRSTITFTPKTAFIWGPFLKAVGMVDGAGQVNLGQLDPATLEGKMVMAKVMGYSWKDSFSGSYLRSYGKNKSPLPKDGTPYYEELGNWAAYEASTEGDNLEGIGEFDPNDYI